MACRSSDGCRTRPCARPRCGVERARRARSSARIAVARRRDQAFRRRRPPSRARATAPMPWWSGTCPMSESPRLRRALAGVAVRDPVLPAAARACRDWPLQPVLHDPRHRPRRGRCAVRATCVAAAGLGDCRARSCSAAALQAARRARCRRARHAAGARMASWTKSDRCIVERRCRAAFAGTATQAPFAAVAAALAGSAKSELHRAAHAAAGPTATLTPLRTACIACGAPAAARSRSRRCRCRASASTRLRRWSTRCRRSRTTTSASTRSTCGSCWRPRRRQQIAEAVAAIEAATGLPVLRVSEGARVLRRAEAGRMSTTTMPATDAIDRRLMLATQGGLPLVPRAVSRGRAAARHRARTRSWRACER